MLTNSGQQTETPWKNVGTEANMTPLDNVNSRLTQQQMSRRRGFVKVNPVYSSFGPVRPATTQVVIDRNGGGMNNHLLRQQGAFETVKPDDSGWAPQHQNLIQSNTATDLASVEMRSVFVVVNYNVYSGGDLLVFSKLASRTKNKGGKMLW